MHKQIASSEAGFTIIELIVAAAIIVVLAGLSIQAYVIYREDAYHKIAMQMMGQARTSMEAGKVDSESFPNSNLLFESTASGPAEGQDSDLIVPGLVLPEDFYVYVFHNPDCSTTACIEDYVITRHCKANQRVVYWKSYQVGETILFNSSESGSC